MKNRIPVLIVGAGPVGLALAGDLGWRGVESLLVEQTDGIVEQPKMDMIGVRTMEFCRRWGIVPWVESAGYNRDYIQDCAWVTDLNGFEFGRERFPSPREEGYPAQSPQKRERCPQNFFDPVLRRFALSTGKAEIRTETELLSFEDHGEFVTAVLLDKRSGERYEVEADYLIGCDGGSSRVRETLNINMSGEGVLTYTNNAIFQTKDLESLHKMDPAYRYIFIGPEGTWATLVAIDGRDRWRFSLVGDDNKKKATEEDMRAGIVRAVGRDFEFEILSILPWVRRQLVADSYGRGRVFIAGDAAHLTSPTGGFGMNTGILDAVNLSWKLAGLLQGWGGAALLDSYEIEQHPVAVRNVNEAGGNLKRMLSPRVVRPDPQVFENATDPATIKARKEYGDAYTEMMKREWFSIGIHLGYLYEGSPVIFPDGSAMPELEVTDYKPTARPGSRAPHVWLSDGVSIIDEFGKDFVLLRFEPDAEISGFVAAAEEAGLPFRVVDIDHANARALYERKLVLVRPDGSVCWRGDEEPADARTVVDVVRGMSNAFAVSGAETKEAIA